MRFDLRMCYVFCLVLSLSISYRIEAKETFSVLVCYPGGGSIKASQAQPALDRMLGVLETLGGWKKGTFPVTFTANVTACRTMMSQQKPALALLSLGLFLEHRQVHHLLPLVSPQINGENTDVYRIIVKRGRYATLEALKGKTLGGNLLEEETFLKKVVLENKLDPSKHFVLKPVKRALRALRKLARNKLDAVLVNSQQYKALAALPFSAELEPVFTSKKLPLVGLVADEKQIDQSTRERLKKAIVDLCQAEQGREICEMFSLETFVPISPGAYKVVISLWNHE